MKQLKFEVTGDELSAFADICKRNRTNNIDTFRDMLKPKQPQVTVERRPGLTEHCTVIEDDEAEQIGTYLTKFVMSLLIRAREDVSEFPPITLASLRQAATKKGQ